MLEGLLPETGSAGWRLYVQVDVAPKEHYERMFAGVLNDSEVKLDRETRTILTAALAEARNTRYVLRLGERTLADGIAN